MSGDHLLGLPEVRLNLAGGALFVTVTVAERLGTDTLAALAVCVVVLALGGHGLRPAYAVLLGVTGWALLTGFVVHSGGRLTFGPDDLARLAILLLVGLATGSVPRAPRRVVGPSTRRRASGGTRPRAGSR